MKRFGPATLLMLAALFASATVFAQGTDDHINDRVEFPVEKRLAAAILERVDRRRPVLIVENGPDAQLAVGPYVIFRLVDAGMSVKVSTLATTSYGTSRRYRVGTDPQVVLITSGKAELPSGPGELIDFQSFDRGPSARFDALASARSALIAKLSKTALGAKVTLAPGAGAFMQQRYSDLERYTLGAAFVSLPTNPRPALLNDQFLQLVLAGVVVSPAFDRSDVQQLLALPPAPKLGFWRGEQVQARLLSIEQLRASEFRTFR